MPRPRTRVSRRQCPRGRIVESRQEGLRVSRRGEGDRPPQWPQAVRWAGRPRRPRWSWCRRCRAPGRVPWSPSHRRWTAIRGRQVGEWARISSTSRSASSAVRDHGVGGQRLHEGWCGGCADPRANGVPARARAVSVSNVACCARRSTTRCGQARPPARRESTPPAWTSVGSSTMASSGAQGDGSLVGQAQDDRVSPAVHDGIDERHDGDAVPERARAASGSDAATPLGVLVEHLGLHPLERLGTALRSAAGCASS